MGRWKVSAVGAMSACALWLTVGAGHASAQPAPRVGSSAQPTPQVGARPNPNVPAPQPHVEDLGKQRYRIGAFEVDKRKQRFTVPATILRREPPLEFLAVSRGGYKAYESLLELDGTAHEFNLACILIGLDSKDATPARYHFDPQPTKGDPVDVGVGWPVGGRMTWTEAADLIRLGEKTLPRAAWVYTGSVVAPNGQYLAHLDGTLIGFVHDPATIIEHQTGLIGNFGAVTPNAKLVPPVGTRVTVSVARPQQHARSPKKKE